MQIQESETNIYQRHERKRKLGNFHHKNIQNLFLVIVLVTKMKRRLMIIFKPCALYLVLLISKVVDCYRRMQNEHIEGPT